jgi:NAD(P)-dependent dehydrogenase (short-subunit alcohol dehydrogenase family)
MGELRFDGRVAIVTGAGGNPSLGRSYAQLLASRGAKVVVNDLGVGPDGRGIQRANAEAVAAEIRDAGGEAIADLNSVAGSDSAKAVVQTALDAYGQVDILINNAGVAILAEFDEISDADIDKVIDVHVKGQIWMARAVWPHMKERGYGRIVDITSGAMFGLKYVTIYGAAKGGVFGLARGLAVEGRHFGIKVNALGPAAATIAIVHLNVESEWSKNQMETMPAEKVAPAVALLAHEDCPCSGKYIEAVAGRVTERFFGETQGYYNAEITLEDLAENWERVVDRTDPAWLGDIGVFEDTDIISPKPYVPA